MEKKKFEALLVLIVPQVVKLIMENHVMDEVSAAKSFYDSKTYALLEDEETKVWHFSPLTIYHMFDEEMAEGGITFPEEV